MSDIRSRRMCLFIDTSWDDGCNTGKEGGKELEGRNLRDNNISGLCPLQMTRLNPLPFLRAAVFALMKHPIVARSHITYPFKTSSTFLGKYLILTHYTTLAEQAVTQLHKVAYLGGVQSQGLT
jgi:hypothetical protein